MKKKIDDTRRLDAIRRLSKLRKKKLWRSLIGTGTELLQEPDDRLSARIHSEVANAYREVRQYDLARKHLAAAMSLRPDNLLVLRRLAELESAEGNFEAAAAMWQSLRKKKGKRAQSTIFLNLARAQRHLGQLDAAKATAGDGCARNPGGTNLRRELQLITSMLNDDTECRLAQKRRTSPDGAHPYQDLDSANYWKRTVTPRNGLEIDNWYRKKFSISGLSVSSAGSCFAQHIGRALRDNGFDYIDVEPAPNFLRPESHHDYGYSIYSARFGNIYTSRQLLQLLQQSLGQFEPTDSIWEKEGGYVDALRPTIHPEPAESHEEVLRSRENHLQAVERMFKLSDLFIFTMGLTETWISNDDGTAYPVAPGVAGGKYHSARYSFKNLTYPEVLADMEEFIRLARVVNPRLKLILTVSPVPLMATATTDNVVAASVYSKSVLRAVAGDLRNRYEFVDYFPSYEIIGSHVMRGQFFNPDGRTVSMYGVSHVMDQFFSEHRPPEIEPRPGSAIADPDDVICDEELLAEFGQP